MQKNKNQVTSIAQLMFPPEITKLDPWQVAVLETDALEVALNIHRGCGKTTICAIKAAIHALTVPRRFVACIATSYRQSLELGGHIRDRLETYRENLQKINPDVTVDLGLTRDTQADFVLPNGSRIMALPPNEKTIRGISRPVPPTLVLVDEASRFSDDIYLGVIRPWRFASPNMQLMLLSTPFGQRGFFWTEWRNGYFAKDKKKEGAYLKFQNNILDSIKLGRTTKEFAESERRRLGQLYYDQELMCSFLGNVSSIFSRPELDAATVDGPVMEALYTLCS